MNISKQAKEDRVVPKPPEKTRQGTATRVSANTNAAVVETSGLPQPLIAVASVDDDAQSLVIAAPPASATVTSEQQRSSFDDNDINNAPTHIPVVEENSSSSSNNGKTKSEKGTMNVEVEEDTENSKAVDLDEDNISDESEYEYEDDDDAAFSGFLMANNSYGTTSSSSNNNIVTTSSTSPARIVEEDTGTNTAVAASAPYSLSATASSASTATSSFVVGETEISSASPPRKKWREPSRAAVNMSLRAQQETSGSKRRLAQDLYRIMNQDTQEAGFSLAPQTEDSMEKWTIKLFQFDPDSNLAKDMMVLGIDHVEIEMQFPEQYPFEPPFVRVVKPRFKRQTGFVMNGALCMELLTKDGWNPINDIESVIVSVRSLLVVGDGRLQAATEMTKSRYETLLLSAQQEKTSGIDSSEEPEQKKARIEDDQRSAVPKSRVGSYTATEAQAAYSHLSDYHKKKGWDTSGWWARKG